MASVESVTGPIDLDDLGTTLIHEHLKVRSEPSGEQYPHLYDEDEAFERVTKVARALVDQGVKTIGDPSCMFLGRDIRFMRRVAEETGLQVVPCTGIYTYDYLPPYFQTRDADAMAACFVHDIETGIQGTEIKAAFLKCAVDEPGLTDDVERVLRAVAQVSLKTGRPIMAHSQPATRRGLEIMDVFDDEGIDPRKVQIAHTGDTDDLDYIEELLARGPWIGMDRYGLDIFLPTDQRNATVIELCKRGYANRMTLSQDACATMDWYPPELKPQLAPEWDFTFLWRGVLPALSDGGVSDDEIDTMMRENPRAWLTA